MKLIQLVGLSSLLIIACPMTVSAATLPPATTVTVSNPTCGMVLGEGQQNVTYKIMNAITCDPYEPRASAPKAEDHMALVLRGNNNKFDMTALAGRVAVDCRNSGYRYYGVELSGTANQLGTRTLSKALKYNQAIIRNCSTGGLRVLGEAHVVNGIRVEGTQIIGVFMPANNSTITNTTATNEEINRNVAASATRGKFGFYVGGNSNTLSGNQALHYQKLSFTGDFMGGFMIQGNMNTLTDNESLNNGVGIQIPGANNTLLKNRVNLNQSIGIRVSGAGNKLGGDKNSEANRVRNNGQAGILLARTFGHPGVANIVRKNVVDSNGLATAIPSYLRTAADYSPIEAKALDFTVLSTLGTLDPSDVVNRTAAQTKHTFAMVERLNMEPEVFVDVVSRQCNGVLSDNNLKLGQAEIINGQVQLPTISFKSIPCD